ncbi:B12-binding domain-containing radical SAM protein, partial [Patescibacteria group bacterium]|nr:B12-binding domain-containing radical SAM protein [Patescibacteria group bacterium]
MKQKVCLIITPSPFLLDERVFMSLGILRIAAVLEANGFPVDVLDLSGISNFESVVRDYIQKSETLFFGITTTTPQLPSAVAITKIIKEFNPKAKVILGGPHVTLINSAYKLEKKKGLLGRATRAMDLMKDCFDILVTGDGERAIFVALQNNASKIIDADELSSDLFIRHQDVLPCPARHLVDVSSYKYSIDGERALSLISQLGCPFGCGFCGGRSSPSFRRIRSRSTENIVAEMVHLYKTYGIKGFMFYDDELNVSPKMIELMKAIKDAQVSLGVEWRLRGFLKSQLFTEEQAKIMYDAGFRWLLIGFESGSEKILENINKRATVEDNTRCMNIARKYGLKVKALMSIGHPGESMETIQETHDWLLAVKPDDFDVTMITVYPGSPYYDEATMNSDDHWVYSCKNGDILYQIEIDYMETAEYYKGDPNGGYKSFVFTDFLSTEKLVEMRDSLEKDVRKILGIPFNPSSSALRYEHSMGQTEIPKHILKSSPRKN